MTDRIRTGQIGVGGFGGYRRQKMRETGLFDMLAVCDHNPDNLKKAALEENAAACASFDELLAVPRLEAVVISTGATSHTDLAVKAMRAGKHVFVEKPLCCSTAEVDELRKVQRETGRVVGVGHGHVEDGQAYLLARQYIDEGRLGTLATYEENTSHSGGLEIRPGDWRGKADSNPGGMLFQCGVHALHRLTALFGPVKEVMCMMRHDVHTTETADVANVLIRHQSGLIGTLNCYHVTAYIHELHLFGTGGNLYMTSQPEAALFQQRLRNEVETRVPVEMPKLAHEGHTQNLVTWRNAIRGIGEASPSLEDGIQAVLPVFTAEISAQTGRLVAL